MSSKFQYVALLMGVFFISGCATTKYGYKNKSLPDKEIAKIRQAKVNSVWDAYFSDYLNLSEGFNKNDWKSVGNHFTGFSGRLNLLPGVYLIRFMCSTGSSVAYPSVEIKVEQGRIYGARCFNGVDNMVGVEINEMTENQVKL